MRACLDELVGRVACKGARRWSMAMDSIALSTRVPLGVSRTPGVVHQHSVVTVRVGDGCARDTWRLILCALIPTAFIEIMARWSQRRRLIILYLEHGGELTMIVTFRRYVIRVTVARQL